MHINISGFDLLKNQTSAPQPAFSRLNTAAATTVASPISVEKWLDCNRISKCLLIIKNHDVFKCGSRDFVVDTKQMRRLGNMIGRLERFYNEETLTSHDRRSSYVKY